MNSVLAILLKPLFAAACTPHGFFFFPSWYEYLPTGVDNYGQCVVQPNLTGFPENILPIGLALIDILIRAAGFVAVGSIIYAGINYMTAMGNAENAAKARKRVYYALISLGIVFGASAAVQFVGKVVIK